LVSGSTYNHEYENISDTMPTEILDTLKRYDASGNIFDNFAYQYLVENNHLVKNRLYHINDPATPLTSGADIIDQGTFTSTPAI